MNSKIEEYFDKIELRLIENPIYKNYAIIRKDILYTEAKVRIKIELINEDTVELFEYINETAGELISKKYSFHWQDNKGIIKQRWDNAPHHKELKNFPHHIHFKDNQIKYNSIAPNILNILDMIEKSQNDSS